MDTRTHLMTCVPSCSSSLSLNHDELKKRLALIDKTNKKKPLDTYRWEVLGSTLVDDEIDNKLLTDSLLEHTYNA